MYDPPLLLFALSLSSGTVQDFGCVHDWVRGPCTDSVFLSCIVSKKMTVMCIFFHVQLMSTTMNHTKPIRFFLIGVIQKKKLKHCF